jgi:antitoxin (DNA-binding transcriptional repressor) of toxin-antitoxin stability system
MTMLSPAKARAKLSHWLKRAAAGENIGIRCGDQVIALRPEQTPAPVGGYAIREYDVTGAELAAFAKRVKAESTRDRHMGKMKRFTGDFHAAIRD